MSWYKDGLKFKCTGCGGCCTGEPGYVWVNREEMETMAARLGITLEKFIQTYTRQIFGRYSLRENRVTYDCVFLKGKECAVYEARPLQCRTFPWWKENLESPVTWEETKRRCEGIDHPEAPLVSLNVIEQELNR